MINRFIEQIRTRTDIALPLLARLSIGATFWQSGQTKIQGFVVDLVGGKIALGWPRLSDSVVDLFRDEYKLPILPPDIAAILAASAEHILPLMLFLGLGTRWGALGLLGMTLVIQLFVYPSAWPTHGVWAVALLYLLAHGGGRFSLDALIMKQMQKIRKTA